MQLTVALSLISIFGMSHQHQGYFLIFQRIQSEQNKKILGLQPAEPSCDIFQVKFTTCQLIWYCCKAINAAYRHILTMTNSHHGGFLSVSFLSDPGIPGVRSMCLSVSNWVSKWRLCRLNWCDSGWWRYQAMQAMQAMQVMQVMQVEQGMQVMQVMQVILWQSLSGSCLQWCSACIFTFIVFARSSQSVW